MAGASLLTLLDDIATILDDVAAMSKVAARKTAGVLGDDLALNAQQVSGVASERELPVVWAVALGSFRNKLILVPAALVISAFIPWAIMPLLMFGGLFLCYEGFEKLHHSYQHKPSQQAEEIEVEQKLAWDVADLQTYEKEKIKGAIRTDFVLSAEIIAISLGVVAESDLMSQFLTLSVIAVVMTVGVYGLVAGIVKIDDLGFYLNKRQGEGLFNRVGRYIGLKLIIAAPYLMKILTVVGTIAMFMVGGGILTHGIHVVGAYIEHVAVWVAQLDYIGSLLSLFTPSILNAFFGIVAGAIALAIMTLIKKVRA
jgi:predicted DNA repair protein MutK